MLTVVISKNMFESYYSKNNEKHRKITKACPSKFHLLLRFQVFLTNQIFCLKFIFIGTGVFFFSFVAILVFDFCTMLSLQVFFLQKLSLWPLSHFKYEKLFFAWRAKESPADGRRIIPSEPLMGFWCPSGYREFLITMTSAISNRLGVAAP